MSDRSSTDLRGAGWLRRIAQATTPGRDSLAHTIANGSRGVQGQAAEMGGMTPDPATRTPISTQQGLTAQRCFGLALPPGVDLHLADHAPAIIAIGGGKGGVGKSLVSANLAARIASTGRRVVAIDCDMGGSNLHTYFGIQTPRSNLADVVLGGHRHLGDVVVPTGIAGLDLVAGGRDELWGTPQAYDEKAQRRMLSAILGARSDLGCDVVVLDLGAGSQRHTVDFFALAHLALITVLPEPTSIENAYLFLRVWLMRLLDNVGYHSGMPDVAAEVKRVLFDAASTDRLGRQVGYAEKLRQLNSVHAAFMPILRQALAGRLVGVAVNQVRSQKDIDVGKSMAVIGERYFGFKSSFCGYLTHDDAAWKSLRNRRLLLTDFPQSTLARRIGELTQTVLAQVAPLTERAG